MPESLEASLRPDEIETLNAHGPYNHAVWRGKSITISQEDSLAGRSHFLERTVRQFLSETFPPDKLSQLSIVDVGCYDGWLIEQLSSLPFKCVVGIEPRNRNIEKGRKVRELLKIESRVEYRIGDLDSLGAECFDIVLCCGVLHHVENTIAAVRSLKAICRVALFVETQCLSQKNITPTLAAEIEPKDVAYFGAEKTIGISGHKLETGYFDGSTINFSVVSIPSPDTVALALHQAGFSNVRMTAQAGAKNWRGRIRRSAAKECCFVAEVSDQPSEPDHILRYETAAMRARFPHELVQRLFRKFCEGERSMPRSRSEFLIVMHVTGPQLLARWALAGLRRNWPDPDAIETIKNFRYAPFDKLAFEYAKMKLGQNQLSECSEVAKRVTTRINADWRSCYRCFVLLAWAAHKSGDQSSKKKYVNLTLTSNPHFPIMLMPPRD